MRYHKTLNVVRLRLLKFDRPLAKPSGKLALSMILGGAIGNFIDRVTKGTVTDFIDPAYYPAFNIADSAIVCGVAAILILTWFTPDAPKAGRDS